MARVFSLGLVENRGKYLLLKRINPPRIWSPPGGWVELLESPEEGVKREIKEETNLEVEVISPVFVWSKAKARVLGIIYLCRYQKGQLNINSEFSAFTWKTIEEMKEEKILSSPTVEEIEKADKILQCIGSLK